ncbi:NAD(P)-dependent oxidoreductase [Candidatus Poribacteria bacterium]
MADKVVLDPAFRRLENIFTPEDLARLHSLADVVWGKDEQIPESELDAVRDEVVAIITGYWRYGDVSKYPKLRAIMEVGGGFPSPKHLDYATCFARGIRVMSCAPAFGPAVAEMGLGLAIAAARQIVWNDAAFRIGEAKWSHTEFGGTFTLYGKQMGFIGFGGLARSLKPLLEPFHCPIQVYDPWLTDTYLRTQGVKSVDLDTLLATSRFIFVLAVPTASNKALLDREYLSKIKPDSVFVLLSRSHVVDFDVLTEMLAENRFKAAIDVYPEEPLPVDHPICNQTSVILSSHRAGAIGEALLNIGHIVVNDMEAILDGRIPQEMQVAQPEYIRMREGEQSS